MIIKQTLLKIRKKGRNKEKIKLVIDLIHGIHIFSSLKISNKNILKNILEI